jgi:uncharacterized protein (DUF1697 family)
MSQYISMLRGINVGGRKKLSMETVREIYREAGLGNVRTYLQSGNVVFESGENDPSRLIADIEKRIQQSYGDPIKVFIRFPEDFKRILHNNPFLKDQRVEQSKLHVTFLYQEPAANAWEKISSPAGGADEFAPGIQEIFLYCPNGYGRTKLSNSYFERKLGVVATTRNWNTVSALFKLSLEKSPSKE